jgi:hypothetical protein
MNTDNNMNESKDTLRVYLREELDASRKRLESLKGSLRAEDFNTLEEELNERSETLDSLKDEDETQLFILRREIGLLQENMESLAVKQGWWARLPIYARILLFTVPLVLYLFVLSLIQWLNRGQVYDYPATQTAIAAQTMPAASQGTLPSPTATPTPSLTPAP